MVLLTTIENLLGRWGIMNDGTLNNVIDLLEGALESGKSDLELVCWFMGEEELIKQTLEELKYYRQEKKIHG